MKIQLTAALAAFFLASTLHAQTREIAFESHGGSPDHYALIDRDEITGAEDAGYGLPVPEMVKTYKLDSVVFISESVSVIYKKEYSRLKTDPKDSARFTKIVVDSLFNDPLFSRQHALDSIRSVIKKQGYYMNAANLKKVVFRGYDNTLPLKKPQLTQHSVPLVITVDRPQDPPPFDGKVIGILSLIFMLALLGGWLSWRFYQPRTPDAR